MQFFKGEQRYIFYHVAAIILVLIVGAMIMSNVYWRYDDIQRTQILQNTSMVAAGFDQNRIQRLTGTEADFTSPDYVYLKDKLAKIKAANPSVRFVYLVGLRDGQPFFFADSEPDSSEDSSPPGQIYTEADASFTKPFFTGKPIVDGIYPDRWGVFLTALAPVFDPVDPSKVIAEVGIDEDASNRTLYLLINASPVMFPAVFFCLLILGNLLLKKRDEDLKHLREDFSSMMVHELRTPLDNIKKISELLLQQKLSKENTEYLHFIMQDSSRMLELVNDLLDVAKLEAGKFQIKKQPSDLREIIQERVNFFKTTADFSNVTLKTHFDAALPSRIDFDPTRIAQVLNNLLSNAIKFTPENGTVTIDALMHKKGHNIEDEASVAGVRWFLHNNMSVMHDIPDSLIIAVSDTGIGISPDKISQLFSKFKQLNMKKGLGRKFRRTMGTGLGLVVVKGIVGAHGGVVSVESKEGVGSSFYFTVPV